MDLFLGYAFGNIGHAFEQYEQYVPAKKAQRETLPIW